MFNAEEMSERILCELEEWGQENLPTLLNTCCPHEGSPEEFELLKAALTELYASRLVRFAIPDADERDFQIADDDVSTGILNSLGQFLRYDHGDGFWTGTEGPWPEVVATPVAQRRGREIINARGYQWWRQKEA